MQGPSAICLTHRCACHSEGLMNMRLVKRGQDRPCRSRPCFQLIEQHLMF
jgi:hypothetical protein